MFLARDLRHDRPVALKVLRPEIAGHIGAGRFLREIEIVAKLQHPHILPLYDSGEADGHLFFVMPFVEGEALRERMERDGRLDAGEALAIVRDVASALAFAHERGIIHRDIKPENIYLIGGSAVVADFGIARALTAAREERAARAERLTDAGLAVGTPTYMSPEQASGQDDVDERSDIYALACVLYEMLAGEPPFKAFTPSGMLAAHVSEEPPPLRQRVPEVPEAVARAIHRALAKDPAERFASVREFADALHVSLAGGRAGRRWAMAGGAVGGLAAALGLGVFFGAFEPVPVNPDLHVVMPFAYEGARPDSGLTAAQLGQLLHDAIGHWDDLTVVGPVRVYDMWARRGNPAPTLEEARRAATDLAAGRLAWAQAREVGDSLEVRAALYDIAHRGRLVRELTLRVPKFPRTMADVSVPMRRLANTLVLTGEAPESVATAPLGTQLLAAWRRYADGQAALQRWDLAAASAAFADAARLDPGYAQAQLWGAQVATWADQPSPRWQPLAFGAVQNGRRLTNRTDSLRAQALLAIADSAFQESCDLYRRLIARDSLDATAWYGLGECQTRDPVVLRDRASPSGWRFRGSYHTGILAYQRALELVPSFNFAFGQRAYDRLTRVLHVERAHTRRGYAASPDSGAFAAFGTLVSDTLAYIPWRQLDLRAAGTALDLAVARNRRVFSTLVDRWLQAFPSDPRARINAAVVLELTETLAAPAGDRSAVTEARAARASARSSSELIDAAAVEVRVHLKLGDFESARRVADSALAVVADVDSAAADNAGGLAALLGRGHLAAALESRLAGDSATRVPGGGRMAMPRRTGEALMRLWAYAAMGGPADSIRATRQRVETALAIGLTAPRARALRRASLTLPDFIAFGAVGPGPTHRESSAFPWVEVQRRAVARDAAGVRAVLRTYQAAGAATADSTRFVTPIIGLPIAEALLTIGDTAAAIVYLDAGVARLRYASTSVASGVELAGPLVRAMVLRAQLAASAGDPPVARRWALAVMALWSGGDPEWRRVAEQLGRL